MKRSYLCLAVFFCVCYLAKPDESDDQDEPPKSIEGPKEPENQEEPDYTEQEKQGGEIEQPEQNEQIRQAARTGGTAPTNEPTEEPTTGPIAEVYSTMSSSPSPTMTALTFSIPKSTKLVRYRFESVDYDLLPPELAYPQHDCYGQFLRCIRFRTDHFVVCGFNWKTGYYNDFYSPCEIERQNCHYRIANGYGGIYGTAYYNDVLYYNGEGSDCLWYLRRARNKEEMDKLYFGGGRTGDDEK